MKKLRVSCRQILRAIHAACVALFFAACASKANAQPFYNDYTQVGPTSFVGNPVMDTSGAYFFGATPGPGYTISVGSSSDLGNTTGTPEIEFDHGSVSNAGTLTSSGSAIYIHNAGSVTNSGYIQGTSNSGIFIGGGGSVSNSGSGYIKSSAENGVDIVGTGTVSNSGTASIYGSHSGVYITGNGTVTNSATIQGGPIQGGGKTSFSGVQIGGTGTVTNSGYIGGRQGITIGGAGTVTNSGYIHGTGGKTGSGIYIGGIGTVTNSGSGYIKGNRDGVLIENNGTVSNSGQGNIFGSGSGVYIVGTGIVTNTNTNLGGIKGGADYGVYIGGTGTVTSSSYIGGSKSGVYLNTTGNVTNSGYISGFGKNATGVYIKNAGGTVINSGSGYIKGTGSAVYLANGGTVINSASIYSTGGNGVDLNGAGTVINSGMINTGSNNTWSVYFNGPGKLVNTGSMTSGYGVVYLSTGSLYNSATGSIVATDGRGAYFTGAGTVYNKGVITGDNGVAVELVSASSSLLTEGGVITGSAGYSISLDGGTSSVSVVGRTNIVGTIQGNNGLGNVLNLNLAGMTPTEAALLNAQSGNSSGTGTVGTYTYSWVNFPSTKIHAVSLEQVVDSGLNSVATKIDSNTLPLAYDPLYAAAAINPEAALNNFTGREFLDAFRIQGLSDATAFSELADGRAFDLRAGATGLDFTGLNVRSDSMIASLGDTENILHRLSSAELGGTEMSDSKEAVEVASPASSPWAAWVSGTVTIADDSNSATNPGFTSTSGSPTVGFDYRLCPDLVLGALFNYTTAGDYFTSGSRLDTDTELLGVYADWAHDHWFANGLVGGGYSSYNQKRSTLAPGAPLAVASPDGDEVIANVTGGYDFKFDKWILSPEAGVLYTHLSKDGFSETGAGAFDLNVGSQDVDSLRTKLGFNASRPFTWDMIKFTPEVHAFWYHECLNDINGVSTSVPGAPALGSFIVNTNPEGRDFALVGAGLSATPAEFHDNVTFFLNYDAQAGQTNYIAHTMDGGIRVNF